MNKYKPELLLLAGLSLLIVIYKIGKFWNDYETLSKIIVVGSLLGGIYSLGYALTLKQE